MVPSLRNWNLVLSLCLVAISTCLPGAERVPVLLAAVSPGPQTIRSFDSYVSKTEEKNAKSLTSGSFLWIDDLEKADRDATYAKLKRGEVVLQRILPQGQDREISGGMIHDWEGIAFIPKATLNEVLTLLQDYDRQSTYFAPDVEKSKIEEHSGNYYRVFLRFRRKKIITVVLNSEHDVNYFSDSSTRAHSRSSATRIAEVENAGEPSEKEKLPGHDNGFMWRMETWWRLEEKDGGCNWQTQL